MRKWICVFSEQSSEVPVLPILLSNFLATVQMRTLVTLEDLPYIVHFNSSQLDCDDLIKHQYLPTLPSALLGWYKLFMLCFCALLLKFVSAFKTQFLKLISCF